jgi:hypothetical protein
MASILDKLAITAGWSKENILAEFIGMIFLNTKYIGYTHDKKYIYSEKIPKYHINDTDDDTDKINMILWKFKNESMIEINTSDPYNPFHKPKIIELIKLKKDMFINGFAEIYVRIHKKYADPTEYIWNQYSKTSIYEQNPNINNFIDILWLAKYRFANLNYEYWNSTIIIHGYHTQIYLNFVY